MKNDLRMTNQRVEILGELRKNNNHPTTEDLYMRVLKKLPNVSLSTVHRNLEKLSDLGMIQKYEFSGRTKRYDWDVEPHNHIYCQQCQRIDNIELEGNLKPTLPHDHTSGYQIAGCHYYGVYPECQKK